jgi:formylglycine-generating enzyme required for sulfatase activity
MAVPGLVWFAVTLACTLETPPYAENQAATETARSVQATAYSESVRATATAAAPAIQATGTAAAQAAAGAMPAALQPLEKRYGLRFVNVPAGEFIMGKDSPEFGKEAETLYLDEYWVSQNEVTNQQYQAFIEAGGYDDASLWTEAGWAWRDAQPFGQPGCWSNANYNAPHQPVVCISLHEAAAYAAWLSRETGLAVRLPTEAEWEKAARGVDGRLYPWGDEAPDASRANYAAALGAPAPVGVHPAGASPYDVLDMAGNAAEWTGTWVDYADGWRVRGGSWFSLVSDLDSTFGLAYAPDSQMDTIGLRLVVSKD